MFLPPGSQFQGWLRHYYVPYARADGRPVACQQRVSYDDTVIVPRGTAGPAQHTSGIGWPPRGQVPDADADYQREIELRRLSSSEEALEGPLQNAASAQPGTAEVMRVELRCHILARQIVSHKRELQAVQLESGSD